jgi:16S rRNA processing protein RimM
MSEHDDAADHRIKVGHVSAAHGLGGDVKIKSYTEHPLDMLAYGPLTDDLGRTMAISQARALKGGFVVARLAGVSDRNAAEALIGTGLHVERTRLPAPEPDEWYYSDLIGLDVQTTDGGALGRVIAVHDFGAGDILEIGGDDGRPSIMIPFTRACVSDVLIAQRLVIVRLPQELGEPPAGD